VSSRPKFVPGQALFLAPSGAELERGVRAIIETIQDFRLNVTALDGDKLDEIFETGGSAFVSYLTPDGIHVIEAAITRAGATSLALDVPSDVSRIQRRQFVRIDAPLDATCLLLDDRTNRFTPFDGHVIDVGGGGLALAADVIAPQHATVVLSLAIPDDRPVVVVGSVLASDRDPNQRTRRLLRVQFSLIGEADRDRLIRWVFANLRRRAKEGA
jgi:hypothetical protein